MAEYIERKKLNDTLDELCVNDSLYNALQSIPAADVEPVVHAYWTERKVPYGGVFDYSFKCSCCHRETPNRAYVIAPDYCPNCGAKMDGKDGEQNAKT